MLKKTWLSEAGPFPVIWLGQLVSTLGSGLTGFGIGVWVFQKNGSVTQFALISFFVMLPSILVSPLAGALVDRWDRRWTLILANGGAGLCTLVMASLAWSELLEVWHIYLLVAASAAFTAFNFPAMAAATTLIVPRRHLSRAAGMTQVGLSISQIGAPFLAGILLVQIGLFGVILIDVVTFVFDIMVLLSVRIPKPPVSTEGQESQGTLISEAAFGWRYVRSRHGLLALLLLLATTNFSMGIVMSLITPLVLSFASAEVLGVVLGIASSGMLAGSMLMSVWSGPSKRVHLILGALLVQGLILFLGGLKPSAGLVATAGFVFLFMMPVIISSSQAIWQSKVPPDIQGRVFAIRRFIAGSTTPLAFLAAGPLADHVFEPLMASGGALAGSVGRLIGVGEGRGVGLLLILMGALVILAVSLAGRYQRLLKVEEEIPDAVVEEPSMAEAPVSG